MQAGAHQAQALVLVRFVAVTAVLASQLNGLGEKPPDVLGRRHDSSLLIGNVVLHAGSRINSQLDFLVYGPSQAAVVLSGILVISVILGIVNVVFRTVAAQAGGRDLEFARAVAKRQEAEHAEKEADGLGRDRLDGADVDSLRVVAQPVAKVDTRDLQIVKFLAANGAGHC